MFSANRNLDDPNNAEIAAQLEALLGHGHMSHGGSFEVNDRSGDHYLFEESHEEVLLNHDSLPFDIEIIPHHTQDTIAEALLDSEHVHGEHHRDDGMTEDHATHNMESSKVDPGLDEDGFYVEKVSPAHSAAGTMYTSPHGVSVSHHIHRSDNKSFDGTEFEVTAEHSELDGNYLPESVDGDVEIATEHLHLAEDVVMFGTPPIMDNAHEQLIDDETLDRLKEEMKRMDRERTRMNMDGMHREDKTSTRHSHTPKPFIHPGSASHPQQTPFASSSTYKTSQPALTLARTDSLLSANYNTGSTSIGSFQTSNASPQSEASAPPPPPPQKEVRRRVADERRESAGSSSSRHLIPLCEETGKRMMIKDRMDQLARLIRNKMRSAWGVSEEDPLPGPDKGGPDWSKGPKHPENIKFQEDIAGSVFRELANDPSNVVPENQRTLEAAKVAANVSFNNFCKRYAYQTDERWKAKSARDAKRGRRWARKDLKQKKRLKASARLEQPIPQQILRMEYMSSEDSSEGEDSGLAAGTWQFYADMTGRASVDEKVVEVKTPRWRSTQLQGIYDRLDEIAVTQTAETKGKGYTQVPLRRFKLDALRPKNPPRTADSWMFVDGIRPPPLPRKPRRPNDTAKRRAKEAPAGHSRKTGETSKRLKDSPVTNEGQSVHRHSRSLETPLHTSLSQTPARSPDPPNRVEDGTMLDPFNHDQDFGLFDDSPFDTIEENEHFFEPENKCFPPGDPTKQ